MENKLQKTPHVFGYEMTVANIVKLHSRNAHELSASLELNVIKNRLNVF